MRKRFFSFGDKDDDSLDRDSARISDRGSLESILSSVDNELSAAREEEVLLNRYTADPSEADDADLDGLGGLSLDVTDLADEEIDDDVMDIFRTEEDAEVDLSALTIDLEEVSVVDLLNDAKRILNSFRQLADSDPHGTGRGGAA